METLFSNSIKKSLRVWAAGAQSMKSALNGGLIGVGIGVMCSNKGGYGLGHIGTKQGENRYKPVQTGTNRYKKGKKRIFDL
jgi:hypothetical protein